MAKQMKAVYLHAVRDLRVHEEPIPELTEPDHVLVRMGAVGVCGSDCHFYERGRIGPFVVEEPIILGHECAGVVVEVGREVKHLAAGDAVCIEPGVPCRRCRRCREGRYNLCEVGVLFMGTPPRDQGAFRQYLTWPADFVFGLPEGVSVEDGAMVEPLAVGIHACRRAGLAPGQSAAVLGAGPVGLLAMQAAAAYGAHPVVVSDIIPFRLEMARRLGAIPVDASQTDVVAAVREHTGGGADVVIETAGTLNTVRQAVAAAKTGGTVVMVGMMAEDEGMMPVMDMMVREIDVRTVFRYANCYPPALSLIAAGRVDLTPLRTHEFPLERTGEAIETTLSRKSEAVKVLVKP